MSGRVTAESELGPSGEFQDSDKTAYGQEGFRKNTEASSYNVIVDTHGKLAWQDDSSSSWPHLIITSQSVPKEYIDYLNDKHISWIAAGKDKIDLKRAMEIAGDRFA